MPSRPAGTWRGPINIRFQWGPTFATILYFTVYTLYVLVIIVLLAAPLFYFQGIDYVVLFEAGTGLVVLQYHDGSWMTPPNSTLEGIHFSWLTAQDPARHSLTGTAIGPVPYPLPRHFTPERV